MKPVCDLRVLTSPDHHQKWVEVKKMKYCLEEKVVWSGLVGESYQEIKMGYPLKAQPVKLGLESVIF